MSNAVASSRSSRRFALMACLLVVMPGCYRRVSYQSPEGRQVEVVSFGTDTSIGSLEAQTPHGSLKLEDLDSAAVLSQRLAELAAALARQGVGK